MKKYKIVKTEVANLYQECSYSSEVITQALIWEKLRDARDSGLGVLLISADLEELLGLSDRLLVIYEGKIVKELLPKEATPEVLGAYMTGLEQ